MNTRTILLAGGVGSRLNILVRLRAKPAVPFGGIYRIIDFTLSNIANSGLTNVAVLTQYKPLSLMDHIGDGSAWDLSGRTRKVKILPPKTGEKDWDWYKGTADAVRQNLDFVTGDPSCDTILIVSGDHVYSMDYRSLIDFHKRHGAKVTIAMIKISPEEAFNFGMGVVDNQNRIVAWEEKPKKATSDLASMGIYVFDKEYLVRMMRMTKEGDFGQHIIPKAMKEGVVYAYPFKGYWRDVGTLQAYCDANIDMLSPKETSLDPWAWKTKTNVFAENLSYDRPPTRVLPGARLVRSSISPGCVIEGHVERSVLSPGVIVEKGAVILDSVIMHDTVVRKGSSVGRCIIDKKVVVGRNSSLGMGDSSIKNAEFPEQLNSGLTLVGKQAIIPESVRIGTNCIIHPFTTKVDFKGIVVADGMTVKVLESSE
ncbi:MAG: glucose-1-phosphate adenylyltransferase [Syntrophobacterales bacterium]|jgi:glucose-1-phosphate adenylyltransferase|nr:glucose-1-phosphate adenylyltransferase [Syntrophobacterales bacterium]